LFHSFTPGGARTPFLGSQDYERGQAFCGFLALLVIQKLEQRLADKGRPLDWEEVRRGLSALAEVEVEFGGRRRLICPPVEACVGDVLTVLGIKLCDEAAPPTEPGAETPTRPL
jgi:hypothetical protein